MEYEKILNRETWVININVGAEKKAQKKTGEKEGSHTR